jgi:hypothetical protein
VEQDAQRGEELCFYRRQSEITSPGKVEGLYQSLPADVGELCQVVQNLVIHQFWILDEANYGITADTLKGRGRIPNDEINLRSVEQILGFAQDLEDQPLTRPRAVVSRVVGNCRDYSVLLVSMLRHQGIPARVRSGVARYFYPDKVQLEDHFVCEFWNRVEERWQRVDAQIDDVQREVLRMSMDVTDLPVGQFLDAGESYEELKGGRVAPEKIGIFDFRGWSYVHYKLVSDLACLNREEILAWEGWGVCDRIGTEALTEEDANLLERIAELLVAMAAGGARFREVRELYHTHPELQKPADYQPHYWELPDLK